MLPLIFISVLVVVITSLVAILIFTAATQGWFINRLKWYEIIAFLLISMSLFRPGYILDKFYPKYEKQILQVDKINTINFDPEREVHIKITRRTEYGDRYKLFVIEKNSFEKNFNFEQYGINLVDREGRLTVDTLKWNGLAKKSGFETDDIISEFKIENLNRPNKAIVYPFSFLLILILGYNNYRRKIE